MGTIDVEHSDRIHKHNVIPLFDVRIELQNSCVGGSIFSDCSLKFLYIHIEMHYLISIEFIKQIMHENPNN